MVAAWAHGLGIKSRKLREKFPMYQKRRTQRIQNVSRHAGTVAGAGVAGDRGILAPTLPAMYAAALAD